MTKCSSISLSDDHRAALEANRACHGDEILAWKRTQAFILLDEKADPETICWTLNIDPTVLTEWIRAYSADGFTSFGLKDYSQTSISLTDDQRADIKAICRRRKVDALVWKRAQAINLLDAKKDPKTICQVLDIGRTVLTEWCRAFLAKGLAFFGLNDYSRREGHLTFEQEKALKKHFTDNPPSDTHVIRAYILAEYGQQFSISGATKLMKRLDFVYKKPIALAMQADEVAQQAFMDWYKNLLNSLLPNDQVLFLDAVHPEYQSRPSHGWFPKNQKTAIKTTSGRKRFNLQGALNLDGLKFISVQGERINAQTTLQLLKKIEKAYPLAYIIHVILDNARYHHAKLLQPWLNRPGCRIKLHFLPPYAPHLNSIEPLWGLMHKWVTHNQHYDTYEEFTEAVKEFLEITLPENWEQFLDTITDNFRVISPKQYKIIQASKRMG